MMLLTQEIRNRIPKLYANESIGLEAEVVVKFFTPDSGWTWYASEGEPVLDDDGNEIDFRFFGYVDPGDYYGELGYFTLESFEAIRGPYGLKIERDRHYRTQTLKDVMNN